MIQASVQLKWTGTHNDQLRAEATKEVNNLQYVFKDAQQFLSKVISIQMDEPSTRESLNNFVVQLTSAYPFLLMNEHRLADATNSL